MESVERIRNDLVAFLAARLDEDEAAAEDVHNAYECESCMGPPGPFPCNCGYPARVLREVAAKRAILAEHKPYETGGTHLSGPVFCSTCGEEDAVEVPCGTLRHLAAVYSDHPDYRPEWKP
jgi:hypothetical protein